MSVSERGGIAEFFDLRLDGEGQVGILHLGLSAILLRTTQRVLGFDLGSFVIRRRDIAGLRQLDVQFYTHVHFDHWSPRLARAIHERTGALAVVEQQISRRMNGSADWLIAAHAGRLIHVGDTSVTPIAGRHAGPITLFHVRLPVLSVLHAGDSSHVPLDHLRADIAFVPVGGPAPSCSPQSGTAIVRDLRPNVAIPMHGFRRQKRTFDRLVREGAPGTRVLIPRRRVPIVLDLQRRT